MTVLGWILVVSLLAVAALEWWIARVARNDAAALRVAYNSLNESQTVLRDALSRAALRIDSGLKYKDLQTHLLAEVEELKERYARDSGSIASIESREISQAKMNTYLIKICSALAEHMSVHFRVDPSTDKVTVVKQTKKAVRK